MVVEQGQDDVSLLDVLVDGFEKNEGLRGFHWRELPMPKEDAAARRFGPLAEEARRWNGAPLRYQETVARRLAAWPDWEIRQAGRRVMLRIKNSSDGSEEDLGLQGICQLVDTRSMYPQTQ